MRIARFLTILLILSATLAQLQPARANPDFWRHEWPDTDFSSSILPDWSGVFSGGPPKDGIPALSDPWFIDVEKEHRIEGREPVITVEIAGEVARAYPLRYLTWHEIVNDRIGDVPVAVTFCPLCNSALTFDRRVQGRELTFGVTGKLRNSDMIMYDRQTQSWWQQALGQGIVGEMSGQQLTQIASWMESWDTFKARNPRGQVMAKPSLSRPYGRNPYVGYDSLERPFLYSGERPPHGIDPLARVVRVGSRAWPMERLRRAGEIREAEVVISWEAGQASALDAALIAQGRDVGNIRVRDGTGRDVAHDLMFAFAFHAFWPDGNWMLGN